MNRLVRGLGVGIAGLLVLGLCLEGAARPPIVPRTVATSASPDLASAVQRFLQGLPEAQRDAACFALDDAERLDWHFVPRDREGLALKQMAPADRRRAHAVLRAALSSAGYLKATTIFRLEQVLFELESRPDRPATHRDPERYWFSVFGEPGGEAWGLRVEGHHLSMNFTVVDGRPRCTPLFLGTNPAEVRRGPLAGLEVLAEEGRLGRALFLGLGEAPREQALLSEEAPADVLLVPGRDGGFEEAEGVAAAAMDADSRRRLRDLLDLYLDVLRPALVEERRQDLEADFDALRFAWAGSSEEGQGHYYRISGPGFAIEYDNTQNGANHAHALWRDFDGDFGRDLLAEHRRQHHPR